MEHCGEPNPDHFYCRDAFLIIVHLLLGFDCSIITSFSVNTSCSSKIRLPDWHLFAKPTLPLTISDRVCKSIVSYAPNAGVERTLPRTNSPARYLLNLS
jgi:hypothetical protein